MYVARSGMVPFVHGLLVQSFGIQHHYELHCKDRYAGKMTAAEVSQLVQGWWGADVAVS